MLDTPCDKVQVVCRLPGWRVRGEVRPDRSCQQRRTGRGQTKHFPQDGMCGHSRCLPHGRWNNTIHSVSSNTMPASLTILSIIILVPHFSWLWIARLVHMDITLAGFMVSWQVHMDINCNIARLLPKYVQCCHAHLWSFNNTISPKYHYTFYAHGYQLQHV